MMMSRVSLPLVVLSEGLLCRILKQPMSGATMRHGVCAKDVNRVGTNGDMRTPVVPSN